MTSITRSTTCQYLSSLRAPTKERDGPTDDLIAFYDLTDAAAMAELYM